MLPGVFVWFAQIRGIQLQDARSGKLTNIKRRLRVNPPLAEPFDRIMVSLGRTKIVIDR